MTDSGDRFSSRAPTSPEISVDATGDAFAPHPGLSSAKLQPAVDPAVEPTVDWAVDPAVDRAFDEALEVALQRSQEQGLGLDREQLERAKRRILAMEEFLEGRFVIPLTKQKIGWDVLLGLVPGVGDVATFVLGAYIIWEARRFKMRTWDYFRMASNIGIDLLVGFVPVVGDLLDIAWRSNTRNVKILRKHIETLALPASPSETEE